MQGSRLLFTLQHSRCSLSYAMKPHDPVNALDEADATGETAQIFADIRDTMGIPMLTSIWRTLASDTASLEATWKTTKPILASGLPEASLHQALLTCRSLPLAAIVPGQLERAGVPQADRHLIRAILEAYTRSNSLNFLALQGLIAEPSAASTTLQPAAASRRLWPSFPFVE